MPQNIEMRDMAGRERDVIAFLLATNELQRAMAQAQLANLKANACRKELGVPTNTQINIDIARGIYSWASGIPASPLKPISGKDKANGAEHQSVPTRE